MPHRRESDDESTVLSAPTAARLLERASELDAARLAEVRVAELRAAATEAGISADAFNAALEEIQRPAPPAVEPSPVPRRNKPRWKLLAGFVVVAAMFSVFGVQRSVSVPADGLVTETFLLRGCLTSNEARNLIVPILGTTGTAFSPPNAERILHVRASQQQIDRIRMELDRLESPGSTACAARR